MSETTSINLEDCIDVPSEQYIFGIWLRLFGVCNLIDQCIGDFDFGIVDDCASVEIPRSELLHCKQQQIKILDRLEAMIKCVRKKRRE